MLEKKYDVGIFGVWSGCNYGSVATYYALNQVISSMGKSILMIDKPILSENDVERKETHSRRFGREHYHVSKQYRLQDLKELNELCDSFVIGSDQVWNYGISKNFGKAFYLDFALEEKKKIAYAVSFGHGVDFAPGEERVKIAEYMSRFDGISVREADGVKLCKEEYGIQAQQVLDPVFLADPAIYQDLIEKSSCHEEEPFLAAYILDPTPEKREALLHLSKELGDIKIINMLDGLPWLFEKNRDLMNLPNCIENLQVEDWLYYLSHAKFVVTDSCHGASFALIFKKNFIAIANKRRGYSRFKSLSHLFHFDSHLVTDANHILTDRSLLEPIDYAAVEATMKAERKRCYTWLEDVLNQPKKSAAELQAKNVIGKPNLDSPHAIQPAKPASAPAKPAPPISNDFARCKMLVTLLRDYGIKHVVLSAGSRNLNLVRLFENNKCFKTYSVIDERSAGFYAMGIALKLREPVAMCCTSGTAASNYLTSITEAYYQGVPLVVITADRYPCLLGQNEDQTIPQVNMYEKVCKKSVTLPVNTGHLGDWEARRLICEALLEMRHHGLGPVHINIPIASIERPVPPPQVLRLDKKYRKIERITLEDSKQLWDAKVKRLASMKRIMVLYGQQHPLSEEEQRSVEAFAEKFHCVIITDHLSNFRSAHSVLSLSVLRSVDQETFDRDLAPDVLITVGGRRMLNDPSLPKLRAQKRPMGHWRVAQDGAVADTYRKMSNVFECSAKYFFDYFANSAAPCHNTDDYLQAWKAAAEKYETPITKNYEQLYVVEQTVRNLPKHSSVHYGIGNTIMFANRFPIDPTVEVFCNMGTNGIDGSASTFMGHVAVSDNLCFLIISDLSFFYDMNSVWSKPLKGNIRIMMCNNVGTDLLRHLGSPSITHTHNAIARDWVKSLGFTYLTSKNKEEFDENLKRFVSDENVPMFFEAFTRFN